MTRITRLGAICGASISALVLAACATAPAGKVDFDSSNDFSNYQSFAWISENPMKVGKTIVQPRETLEPIIMASIRAELENRGYRYTGDPASADFQVSFTVGSREKLTPDAYPNHQAGRWGWATAYYGGAEGSSYTQGALAIDIFDTEEKRPVWHGVAGRPISEEDRDNMRPVVDDAVASILAEFPPE